MLGTRTRKARRVPAPASPVKSPGRMTLSPLQLSPKKRPQSVPPSPLKLSPAKLSPAKKTGSSSRRKLALSAANTGVHKAVSEVLNVAAPDELLCRGRQTSDIREFIAESVSQKQARSMYISGAPGTGKTACLQKVLADVDDVKKVWVNCMSLQSTNAIYNHLVSKLCASGRQTTMKENEAIKALEKKLVSGSKMILVILDEIDHLEGRNQEILYTIFGWPMLKNSKLVLIGIANSLDLTDRLLPRLTAHVKVRPTLLHFPPYSKQDIVEIISARLAKVPNSDTVVTSAAVHLLAGKVAAVAGDARKALAVCRRAVEVVERKVRRQLLLDIDENIDMTDTPKKPTSGVVGPAVILQVFNEVYENVVVQQCEAGADSFPIHQKLAVCSLLLMLKHGKSKEAQMGKLHETYSRVCKGRHVVPVQQSEFCSVMEMVQARGIVTIKSSKEARLSKLSLMLDETELVRAMQDKELLAAILRDSSSVRK
ncbi:cell division control protein 6 homolog [Amphibalanus amphitrite]|uniref:cell division control protein 6 homolog n=1 Tax=Amphibalanus amphitrite TaxID=1232801 RepID=UPI001C916852|nr:cell division control protein 6 homolog [Amphibalanus amphitrite]